MRARLVLVAALVALAGWTAAHAATIDPEYLFAWSNQADIQEEIAAYQDAHGLDPTAALEQALRDEDPEAHMVCDTGTRRKIGLAEAPQEVKGEPGPVIIDLDRDRRCTP